jgi:ketosteroid isomerase-like protein
LRNVIRLATLGSLALLLGINGCATTGGGASDEELVMGALASWSEAFQSQDLDAVMVHFSEDFDTDLEEVADFFEDLFDSGVEVSVEEATATVNGDTANAGPVAFKGDSGEARLFFHLKKEEGSWLFIGQDGL